MFAKISILAIGKTQKEYQDIENHYLKQIKTKISVQISQPLSYLTSHEQIIKESTALQKNAQGFIISLDSSGFQLTSEEFAEKLNSWSREAKNISFLIGGSHGISPRLKSSSNFLLSLSKFTFPHQVARIILLEQIFRAETIFTGNRYHK